MNTANEETKDKSTTSSANTNSTTNTNKQKDTTTVTKTEQQESQPTRSTSSEANKTAENTTIPSQVVKKTDKKVVIKVAERFPEEKVAYKKAITEASEIVLLFQPNTAVPQVNETQKLQAVGGILNTYPYWGTVLVKGYSDVGATDASLAKRRANFVKRYLMDQLGVKEHSVITEAFEQNERFIKDKTGNPLDKKAVLIYLK